MKHFQCGNCGQVIEVSQGVPKPSNCPKCGAVAIMIHRLGKGPPGGRRGGGPPWQRGPPLVSPFLGFDRQLSVRS